VTRLVSRILSQDLAKASRSVPTAVFVALTSDESWGEAQDVATELRSRGIAAEVAAKAEKFGKQIKFADRRGIPFVWFTDEDGKHQVKDIRSGEQVDADPATWTPSDEDIRVQVAAAPESLSWPGNGPGAPAWCFFGVVAGFAEALGRWCWWSGRCCARG
jgi:histidyl-tRNA synthetase